MKLIYSALILFLPCNFLFAEADNKVLKPVNAKKKIVTIVKGLDRDYYPLTAKNASLISVRGPGQLKIITRARFITHDKSTIDYTVYCRVDGGERKKLDFDAVQRSTKALYKNDSLGIPGDDENIIVDLGAGEHNIKVWLESENPQVAARYIFTPKERKNLTWVSLSPLEPNDPVHLIAGEDEVKYYRFSEDKPLKIKITGPTKLRILTRIENHYKMKGRINYRVEVKEDKKVKHTYQLNSVRSESTNYKKDETKIPGKGKEIVFNVPKGTHYYQITPLDKNKSTVLGRIFFPKKDMKLGE